MPLKWTKRSLPPPSGVMNPKPFSSENHLTVPVPTNDPTCCFGALVRRTHFDRRSAGPNGCRPYTGRATPRKDERPPIVWRCLLAEKRGRRRDLVPVPRRRVPRKLQRVPGVARDHVDVEVKDRLPRLRAA